MRFKVQIVVASVLVLPCAVYSLSSARRSVRASLGTDQPAKWHIEPIPPPANVGKYAEKIRECEQQPAGSMCFNLLADKTAEPYFCERTAMERRRCFSGLAAASGNWQLC